MLSLVGNSVHYCMSTIFWLTNGGVNEYGAVQFFDGRGDLDSGHSVEVAHWMTFRYQLIDRNIVESAGYQHHHIVDHMTIAARWQPSTESFYYEQTQSTIGEGIGFILTTKHHKPAR